MLPSLCCGDRKCVRIVLSVLVFSVFASLASAQTDTWVGTSGKWSDPTQWDNGVPVTGDNIVIGTATANSIDDLSLSISGLTLGNSADALTNSDGVALNVSDTINNAGTITLASAGSNTFLQITGNVSLTGTGEVVMGVNGPEYITGASGMGTEVLTNSSTIAGSGSIGNGAMGLINNGTINGNISYGYIFIKVSSAGFVNNGTVETIGHALYIQGPANSFLNYNATTNTLTGGTYIANGSNNFFAGSASGITTLSARVTQKGDTGLINTTTDAYALANLSSITSSGALTTQVNFTQPGAFNMAGALNILPNTVFNVGSVTNISDLTLTGGQWVLGSDLNITGTPQSILTNSATVTFSGGTFRNRVDGSDAFATMQINEKTLRIVNRAHFTTSVVGLRNDGQLTVAKGSTMTVAGTGTTYTQTAGKTTMDGMLKGRVAVLGGTYCGAGSIVGSFELGSGTTNPTFSVGDAGKSALVTINGNYQQLSDSILSTAIGGATLATQYSQLKVNGAVLLSGGSLTAPLLGGFTPTVGQTFTVLSGKTITGTFSNSTIPINSSEHFAIFYTATSVVLTVVSGPAAE